MPKFARSRRVRARRFSLELNNWSIRSSSIRLFRLNKSAMNNSEKSGSSCNVAIIAALVMRVIRDWSIAVAVVTRSGWPFRHPSPKKVVGFQNTYDCFLAPLGNDGELNLALLDVKNRVRLATLRKNNLVLVILGYRFPIAHFGEKCFRLECGLPTLLHEEVLFPGRSQVMSGNRGSTRAIIQRFRRPR